MPVKPQVCLTAEQLQRPIPGGIGTYVRGLAQGLRELRAPVSLLAGRKTANDPVDELGLSVARSPLPTKYLTRVWDKGQGGSVPKDVDLLHATSMALPPTKKLTTVTIHDAAWQRFPEAYPAGGLAWHQQAFARAVESADAFLTPSAEAAKALKEAGADPKSIFKITEGVDHLAAPSYLEAAELLHGLGVHSGFILTVGTLEPRKNFRTLINCYGRATGNNSMPPLVVVGPDGWGPTIRPVTGVLFAGQVSPGVLSALYERCRFFVSIPLTEGWGLPAAEAMYMGAPVVSSRVPSVGDAAHEVNPIHTDGITEALIRVHTDDDLRAQLKLQSQEHAAELTWRNSAQQHLEIWKHVYDRQ